MWTTRRIPGRLIVSPTWALYRAFGPMGSAVVASAGDVLRLIYAFHIKNGGHRLLLDSELVASMQREYVRLVDDSLLGGSWGLGWNLDRWGDHQIIGHDGNSIGQNAFMRVAPDARFGFCLQTNVGSALNLFLEVAKWLFAERLDVTPRPDPATLDDAAVADTDRYTGTYEREGLRVEVTPTEDKQLVATVLPTRDVEGLNYPPMENLPLRPVDPQGLLLPQGADRQPGPTRGLLQSRPRGRTADVHALRRPSRAATDAYRDPGPLDVLPTEVVNAADRGLASE